MYFEYGDKEIEHLKKRDKLLGAAIDQIGHIDREVEYDLFSSIIHHIIGQQISVKAQATIWKRLIDQVSEINADSIYSLDVNDLQKLGMTYKKAEYIKDFAEKVKNNAFDINELEALSDTEVIQKLSALKGIGVWTAEMLLTFCMRRPDVLSFGDLAIHRGMRMLYHHKSMDKDKFAKYKKRYSPYGTVASLYLWAIAGGAIPEMRDYAPKKKKIR